MLRLLFLFLSAQLICISCKNEQSSAPVNIGAAVFNQTTEADAITAVIENETSCFFARDYECWRGHYAHVDYAFQAWNKMDGTFSASVGWPAINASAGKYIQDNPAPPGGSSHPKVERRNMKTKFFSSTLAYLTWDQYNSNPEMNAYTHSLETRLLEKIGNSWKIVNVTSYWDYVNLVPIDSLK